jgi:hypothetical protein
MLSKPLAYPSTLDRRNRSYAASIRRPTWGSVGARRSCALDKPAGKSRGYFYASLFCVDAQRTFLSQAGPRVQLGFLQAEHHLLCSSFDCPETTKATRRVALARAAMRLAA